MHTSMLIDCLRVWRSVGNIAHCLMNSCLLPHKRIRGFFLFVCFFLSWKYVYTQHVGKKRKEAENSYIAAECLPTCGTDTCLGSCSETGGLWTSHTFLVTSARFRYNLSCWPQVTAVKYRIKPLHALAPFKCDLGKDSSGKRITAVSPSWAHAHKAHCFWQCVLFSHGKKSFLRSMVLFDTSHVWVCEREPIWDSTAFLTIIRCADANAAGTRLHVEGAGPVLVHSLLNSLKWFFYILSCY